MLILGSLQQAKSQFSFEVKSQYLETTVLNHGNLLSWIKYPISQSNPWIDWARATCWCASGLLSVSSQSGSWTSFWVCCPQKTWDGMHTDTPKTHRIQIQKTLDPHRLPKSKVIGHHHHFPSKQPQLQSLLLVKEPKEIDGLAQQAQRLMGIHDMTLHWVRWTGLKCKLVSADKSPAVLASQWQNNEHKAAMDWWTIASLSHFTDNWRLVFTSCQVTAQDSPSQPSQELTLLLTAHQWPCTAKARGSDSNSTAWD